MKDEDSGKLGKLLLSRAVYQLSHSSYVEHNAKAKISNGGIPYPVDDM